MESILIAQLDPVDVMAEQMVKRNKRGKPIKMLAEPPQEESQYDEYAPSGEDKV